MFALAKGFIDLGLTTFLIALSGLQDIPIGRRGDQARVCLNPKLS